MKRARTDQAKDDRRQALIAAALSEFFENGFSAARMDAIAARAGVSKGAVYLYFDSKDALFKALIETYAVPNLARIETIAREAKSVAQALDAMAAFAPAMIRQTDLPRLMKILIGEGHAFPDIVQSYRAGIIDKFLAAIAGLISRARRRGEISCGDPKLVARLIVAPIAFSAMWQAVFGQQKGAEVNLEALFQMHAAFLKKALQPETPA